MISTIIRCISSALMLASALAYYKGDLHGAIMLACYGIFGQLSYLSTK